MQQNKDLQLNMYERFNGAVLDIIAQKTSPTITSPLTALIHSFMDFTSVKQFRTIVPVGTNVITRLISLGFVLEGDARWVKVYLQKTPSDMIHSINMVSIDITLYQDHYHQINMVSTLGSFEGIDVHDPNIIHELANSPEMTFWLLEKHARFLAKEAPYIRHVPPEGLVIPSIDQDLSSILMLTYSAMPRNYWKGSRYVDDGPCYGGVINRRSSYSSVWRTANCVDGQQWPTDPVLFTWSRDPDGSNRPPKLVLYSIDKTKPIDVDDAVHAIIEDARPDLAEDQGTLQLIRDGGMDIEKLFKDAKEEYRKRVFSKPSNQPSK